MDEIKDVAKEITQAVLPVGVLILLLIFFLYEYPWDLILQFSIGLIMVAVGLGMFLVGVKVGLFPLGELIGSELPQHGSFIMLLVFALILGFAVTVAEPDVRVLAHKVDLVSGGEISRHVLVTFVAIGVGIFMAIAAARVVLGVPISYILIAGYGAIFALSTIIPPHFVPISFDAGGTTTGPMTVPFIIALGVGISSVLAGKRSLADSFGFIALASIGPVLAVMLLGVIYQ